MHLVPPALEIGSEEGFTPEKDIFNRARYGDGLINLISQVPDPLVIAVDGPWGSGKSIFLKMWAGELRKALFPVVYFDAYENDYNSDAFLAVAGEIISLLQELKKASTPTSKAFIGKAANAGKVLLRAGIRGGVKAATLGGLDLKEIEGVIADEASKVVDNLIGERLTKQKEEKDTLRAFKDALAELPGQLHNGASTDTKPLVFIIDELDRCRPLFALELLEKIKHFFSAPNIHFVLGVNLVQLRNSVIAAYGTGIDAHTYLEKFIHLTLTFDNYQLHPSETDSRKFLDHLVKAMEFPRTEQRRIELSIKCIERIVILKELNLRSIERIMSNLAIALAFSNQDSLIIPPVLAGLCVLKVIDPARYRQAKRGELSFETVAIVLGLNDSADEGVDWETDYWRYCISDFASDELIEKYDSGMYKYSITRREIVPFTANYILDALKS